MKPDQVHLLVFIGATSVAAVSFVFVTSLLSIFVVYALKSSLAFVIRAIAFVCEVVVAVVAAITSGTTITLSIVTAASAAAVTFPPSSIQARISLSMAISSAATVASAVAVLCLTTMRVDAEIAFAVVSAAAMSVAFAAAWAVGVMMGGRKVSVQCVGFASVCFSLSILDTVRRNNYRILKLLLKLHPTSKRRDLDVALIHAVKAGYMECSKVLLEAGADPDTRDSYDNTPLLLACETGNYDVSKLLVDNGADVGLCHAGGRGTALHHAANWGSDQCVRLLLSRSANPNAVDGMWRTPLMLAAMHAHDANVVLRTLLSAGSDVNAVGAERKTALHYAAARGLDPTALLDANADARAIDSSGNTPLHAAAAAGHALVVRALLPLCDPRTGNDQRRTALHLAAARGDLDCIEAIVEYGGPDVCSLPDAAGHLPVWYAAFHGHYPAAVLFIQINCPFVDRRVCSPSARSVSCFPFPLFQNYLLNEEDGGQSVRTSNPVVAALEKCHVNVAKALLIGGCEGRAAVADWLIGVHERSGAWLDDNEEVVGWLEKFALMPSDLSHLCRLVIRGVLKTRVQEVVPNLTLPKQLQRFLLMQEL